MNRFWVEKHLGPWLERKAFLLAEAAEALGQVARLHVPEWEIAAAARAGDLQYMMSVAIENLPTAGDDDTCRELRSVWKERAEPYREGAVDAYTHCDNIAVKVRWFNDVSLYFGQRLAELAPDEFPPVEEIRPGSFRILNEYQGPLIDGKLLDLPAPQFHPGHPQYHPEFHPRAPHP